MTDREYSTNVALLSRLCTEGGTDADWERFYHNYKSMITRWCHQHGIRASELDDLFHEIMLKLMQNLVKFDRSKGHRFRSWLKTVVLNTLTDRFRTEKPIPPPIGAGDDSIRAVTRLDTSLEQLAEEITEQSTPAASILRRVRDRVSEATWDAFVRRDLLDDDVAAIADSLQIKKASVYQSVSRVRKLVQEESGKWFEENASKG